MRAIRVHATGGPDVLRLEDVPTPAPGPGEILIRHAAVGLNFIDIYQRDGFTSSVAVLQPALQPEDAPNRDPRAGVVQSGLLDPMGDD